jgi:hypothetical protein
MWLARNAKPLVLYPAAEADDAREAVAIDALGGEPIGSENAIVLALMPVTAASRADALFERPAPRGKAILKIDNIELAGLEWAWIKLAIVGVEPGVAGERKRRPKPDSVTEIEITAPRD